MATFTLVISFLHSYTVPKKEASPFNREVGSKVSQSALKIAVEKALLFMTHDELPPHWDRDLLFGMDVSDDDSDRDGSDSDVSVNADHLFNLIYDTDRNSGVKY